MLIAVFITEMVILHKYVYLLLLIALKSTLKSYYCHICKILKFLFLIESEITVVAKEFKKKYFIPVKIYISSAHSS